MGDHAYQVGDRVWWLAEDTRLYRINADVPAVVTHVRRDSVTIQATTPDGRSMTVHVHPARLRPQADARVEPEVPELPPPPVEDEVEFLAPMLAPDPSAVALPAALLADLLTTLATTHKWIETSLAGERAHSFSAAAILDVMKLEFRQIREMNEDAMARARPLLPDPE